MKKHAPPAESSALAPLKQSLPAVPGALNISEAAIAAPVAEFQKIRAKAISSHRGEFVGQRYLAYISAGGTAAMPLIGMSDPVIASIGFFLAAPLALSVSALAFITIAEQKRFQAQSIARQENWVHETLQPAFEKAQKQAYQAQKLQIIAAAEQHLGKGGLLGLEDGAWLANLDPQALEGATDQLAITVLQIRKMLAHERCVSFNADGSKSVGKAVGFAGQKLDACNIQHRSYLRKQLAEEDPGIAEDSYPALQKGELVEAPKLRSGWGPALKSFFVPFYAKALRNEYANAQMPRFKDIEAQPLEPVADFSAAIERYEAQNRPLDLPAMRGWKGAQKALAAPGRAI
jgi:hypothetical protein